MSTRYVSGERFALLATFNAIYENGGISSAAEVQGHEHSGFELNVLELIDARSQNLIYLTLQ